MFILIFFRIRRLFYNERGNSYENFLTNRTKSLPVTFGRNAIGGHGVYRTLESFTCGHPLWYLRDISRGWHVHGFLQCIVLTSPAKNSLRRRENKFLEGFWVLWKIIVKKRTTRDNDFRKTLRFFFLPTRCSFVFKNVWIASSESRHFSRLLEYS